MDLLKKFSFPRVREEIRNLFSVLQFRRNKIKKEILDDTSNLNLLQNISAAEKINKDWQDWMEVRYHNKWTNIQNGKELQNVLSFLQLYLDDVRISKLGEIQNRPEKSLELGQQAEGIFLAIDELAFLIKITEKPTMEVTMQDIH